MIAVMGATGHTGSAVADELLRARRPVRVIGRWAERLEPLVRRGAEPAIGDGLDPEFLASAFRGAEAVFAMVPPDYSQPDLRAFYNRWGAAIAGALERPGVRRAAFLSSLGAELPEGTGPIAGLHDVEQRLEPLGLDLLVLRPGYFYENFFSALPLIKHQGINGGGFAPDTPIPMIATPDIGLAAAEALAGGFRGVRVRELLGPRDYTMTETTRILSQKIGRPDLRYVQFPDRDFADALVRARFSPGSAAALVEMAHAFNEGRVRSLQGRNRLTTTATTFETFSDRLAAAYRSL